VPDRSNSPTLILTLAKKPRRPSTL
jgi:hypothetical protein